MREPAQGWPRVPRAGLGAWAAVNWVAGRSRSLGAYASGVPGPGAYGGPGLAEGTVPARVPGGWPGGVIWMWIGDRAENANGQ